jgi:hypothetical protein
VPVLYLSDSWYRSVRSNTSSFFLLLPSSRPATFHLEFPRHTLAQEHHDPTWLEPYEAPWSVNRLRDRGYWLYQVPRNTAPFVLSNSSTSESLASPDRESTHTIFSNQNRITPLPNMSAVLKIRSFKGIAEPGEDPEEYLDDVQMAAEAWENGKGDAAALEKSLLRFFRQNLEPNYEASWWWGGLSKAEKTTWATVKELFLKKFADPVSTGNDVNYEETNEILGLSQKAGQSIEEYIREAEHHREKKMRALRALRA